MITLEEACKWLNKFEESRLCPCSQQLVDQMNEAILSNNVDQAWLLLERLKSISQNIPDGLEVAEIMTECGRAAYKMGYLKEAVHLLEDASSRYGAHRHQAAVVQWMLGYVLWTLPTRHEDGIVAWQRSLTVFETLAGQRTFSSGSAAWYQARWKEMDESRRCAMEGDCLPPSGKSPTSSKKSVPSHATQPSKGHLSQYLRIFPISDEIPAGGFGPMGVDPNPIGYVDIEIIPIEGKYHRVVSLRSGNIVRLPSIGSYIVLKVKGDSMNLANIDDGDYVLIRPQNTADDNDVVAAEIFNIDSTAKLKLLVKQGGKIILKPCSTNPVHQEQTFTKLNSGFSIRGIVLAVLKPT